MDNHKKTFRGYFGLTIFLLGFLAFCEPGCAQPLRTGAGHLRLKGRELATRFNKESRAQFDLRTHGLVSYADQKPLQVGQEVSFMLSKSDYEEKKPATGTLMVAGKHCYVFLEKGQEVEESTCRRIADAFDTRIYPTNTAWFGSEWNPGIDGDPRIFLFLVGGLKDADGYFDPEDEYTKEKMPTSNEREILYLSTSRLEDLDDFMNHLVAHEFQHMIHWHHDPKEVNWVDEGLAEFAAMLYDTVPWTVTAFFANPDRCLIDWDDSKDSANYSESFLFMNYLIKQSRLNLPRSQAMVRALVANRQTGVLGLAQALKSGGTPTTFNDMFRSFCATTFFNRAGEVENGTFGFDPSVTRALAACKENPLRPRRRFKTPVGKGTGQVKMWSATAYSYSLTPRPETVHVTFKGKTVSTAMGRNAFDVGLAFLDAQKKLRPHVIWLDVRAGGVDQKVTLPTEDYEQMILLVCNRGPMKMPGNEKRFPKVAFTYGVSAPAVSSRGGTPDRRIVRSLVSTAVSGPDEVMEAELLRAIAADMESGSRVVRDEIDLMRSITPTGRGLRLDAIEKRLQEAEQFHRLHSPR